MADKKGFKREKISDFELDRNDLAQYIVQEKLKPLKKQIKAYKFIHFKEIYKQLFSDPANIENFLDGNIPLDWSTICELTVKMLEENTLFYEDATAFLFLRESILSFQQYRAIKHIVVDEAQDYSPFQFEMLKRLYPVAKMTVLGDFNQAIFAHGRDKNSFHMLLNLYGEDEAEMIYLEKSYRSTKPIIEFTKTLIPETEKIIPFEREGNIPSLKQADNRENLHEEIVGKINELQNEGHKSIAVICKSAKESETAFNALREKEEIKLITRGSFEYEHGIVVIPSYLSKGIEFDAVIIYDASEHVYGDESLRKVFYTSCTRAMHELCLFSMGKESHFLQKALQANLIKIN